MIELESISKRTNLGYKKVLLGQKYSYKVDEVYRINEEYALFVEKSRKFCTYCVVAFKTGKVSLVLSTFDFGKYEAINIVEAHSQNKYPAVELYEFLIKRLGKTLVTSEQSRGGMILWQKLSRISGINVHGWNFKTNKPVNTDLYLEDTDDIYVNRDLLNKHKDIGNVNLVAFSKKKVKKEKPCVAK